MKEKLVVVDLDELGRRWQIPVDRIKYLIVECGMDMTAPEKWAAENSEIVLKEKQKAFDEGLFPEKFRAEEPAKVA